MSDILDDYEDAMFDRGKIVEHIPLDRLRELAAAERDGRLVVLPCKVGEQAWCLRNYRGTAHARCGIVSEVKYSDYCGINVVVFNVGRGKWGEKVFSTYAEAAAALAQEPKGAANEHK